NNIKVIEGVNLGVAGNLFADMEVKLRNCNLSMNFSSSFPKGTPTNAFPRLFWTPGSSWAAPSTRKVDATESRKREFLQTAKKLSGKNIDPYSGFILPAPKPFSGNWDEDGMAWIDRFQRHVSTFRTQLLDEELMGYSESFYTGAALVWHKSASILYVAWEDYVSAFLIEFNPEKSKARAQKELESFDFYGKDILSTYASLTKLFRILGIVDKDLKVDALFRKLSRSDRELMINQGFTTVNEIMDCLQSQYKRDKLYGSVHKMQNAVGINSSKVNKKDYQVKQRQCYNRRKLGHLARECPNQGPSQEEVGMLKNELYNMNKRYAYAKDLAKKSVQKERKGDTVQHLDDNPKDLGSVPVCSAQILNKTVSIVIDTGASLNIMSDKLVKELKLKPIDTYKNITTVDK
ncbi:hypothetical protein BB560_005278, partial [Smittium megazygosporum]